MGIRWPGGFGRGGAAVPAVTLLAVALLAVTLLAAACAGDDREDVRDHKGEQEGDPRLGQRPHVLLPSS